MTKTYSELSDKRKADIKAATAQWREKMATITPVAQAMQKAKATRPVYEGDEAAKADGILGEVRRLKSEADELRDRIEARLNARVAEGDAEAEAILKALKKAVGTQFSFAGI